MTRRKRSVSGFVSDSPVDGGNRQTIPPGGETPPLRTPSKVFAGRGQKTLAAYRNEKGNGTQAVPYGVIFDFFVGAGHCPARQRSVSLRTQIFLSLRGAKRRGNLLPVFAGNSPTSPPGTAGASGRPHPTPVQVGFSTVGRGIHDAPQTQRFRVCIVFAGGWGKPPDNTAGRRNAAPTHTFEGFS